MKKIALLSNVTADMIISKLKKKFDVYAPDGFDAWISDVMDPASKTNSAEIDAIFLLLDGTELCHQSEDEVFQKIQLWENVIIKLASQTDALLFVSTIDFRENRIKAYGERKYFWEWSDSWYQFLQGLSEQNKKVYILDILQRIMDKGRDNFYSPKMWYMGSMPYSKLGIETIVEEINLVMGAAFESRKKIAVLDLDNTLWGGVIGEDGVDGIALSEHNEGGRFYDFQRRFLEMEKRGIVLAINSKNNMEDVEGAFQHPNMLLKKEDFVSTKINWNDKALNIKNMSEELNLTEGSFVFIDDNPIEQSIVSGQCPEVFVPAFPKDTVELPAFAERIYRESFQTLRLTEEDAKKTKMYQTEAKRKSIKTDEMDLDSYISLLEMKADIHQMKQEEKERVHQLCNKTNQFNLTTKRYTLKEIEKLATDDNIDIFTISVSDKFGDNGLVSVIIAKRSEKEIIIDTFLMSCRVMGRKLENVIMSVLVEHYKGNGRMIGLYEPTAKNIPVAGLYPKLGFVQINDEDVKQYSYELDKAYHKVDSYAEVRFEGSCV